MERSSALIKLIYAEMQILFFRKEFWRVVAIALFMCIGLHYIYLNNLGIDKISYKKGDLENEQIITEQLENEEYEQFREKIQNEAETYGEISIFDSKESMFSKKNIEKTKRDYEKLPRYRLVRAKAFGLSKVLDAHIVDFVLIIIIFYICMILFFYDKKTGIIKLYRTSLRGNLELAIAKINCLLVYIFLIGVIFQIIAMLLPVFLYGTVDLSFPIQCINSYSHCVLYMNIAQYLTLYIGMKLFVYMIIGLSIALVMIIFKNEYICMAVCGGISVVSVVMNGIGKYERLSILRYINFASALDTTSICRDYLNCNVFGKPVSRLIVNITVFAFTLAIIIFMDIFLFSKSNIDYQQVAFPALRLQASKSLFVDEVYKQFIGRGVLIVVIIMAVTQLYLVQTRELRWNYTEEKYREYMLEVEGNITEEKRAYIQSERQLVEDAKEKIQKYQSLAEKKHLSNSAMALIIEPFEEIVMREDALKMVEQCIYYIDNTKGTKLVYDRGYLYLFSTNYLGKNKELVALLVAIVFLTLAISGMYEQEHITGMDILLEMQTKGRYGLHLHKVGIAIGLAGITALFGFMCDIIYIKNNYSLNFLFARMKSIMSFANFPGIILTWIIIFLIIRIVVYSMIAILLIFIDKIIKNRYATGMVGAILFCISSMFFDMIK